MDENVSYDGLCGLDLPLDRKEGVPEVVLPVDEIYTWVVHGHLTEQQQEIFCRLTFKGSAQMADKLFLTRDRILGRNPEKSVFLLAIHSFLYSFAWRFLFLHTHATSYVKL